MRIIFFGTPLFAKNILEEVHKHFEIAALITQEDKPFGRKKELKAPECKEFILKNNLKIPIFQPKKLSEIIEQIKSLKPDIILVVAYGKILAKEITNNFYCINIHGSILPKYRGASPLHSMILANDKYFGISIIKMNERLDSGEILSLSYVKNNGFNIDETIQNLSHIGANLVIKTLKNLTKIAPLKQLEADCSYCKKINKTDGLIDFSNAKEIYQKYLAYKTWPQIYTIDGTKLFDISLNEANSLNKIGEILEISKDYITIACGVGSIKVRAIQAVGKTKMQASEYINGKRLLKGDIFK